MLTLAESEAALLSGHVAAATRRDIVIVDGPEAASYLHGQVSQNIEGLAVGASAWTLLLEPAGRVTAWARVSRVSDEAFWLDVDEGSGEPMLARLDRFKLRTKAIFELHAAAPTVAVRGPEAPAVAEVRAALAARPSDVASLPTVVVADLSWSKSAGFDILGFDIAAAEALGLVLGDPGIVELERIQAGRPAMGREFAEKTIPAETGVVEQSADFTKGCYVGQELVARVDSRGNNTPRTVHPATLQAASAPASGTELTRDGEVVGMITSAAAGTAQIAALASIKRGVDTPALLQVDLDGVSVDVQVAEVDWA